MGNTLDEPAAWTDVADDRAKPGSIPSLGLEESFRMLGLAIGASVVVTGSM